VRKTILIPILFIWLLFHINPINGKEYLLPVPFTGHDCKLLIKQYQIAKPDTKYMCINLDGYSTKVPTVDGILKDVIRDLRKDIIRDRG